MESVGDMVTFGSCNINNDTNVIYAAVISTAWIVFFLSNNA